MSRSYWREHRDSLSARKKPPPDDGIKMKKAGDTWWGKRWIAALEEVLGGQAGRLARGRTYARSGRVHDLVLDEGRVASRVTGSAAAPYRVTIALEPLPERVWSEAIATMAQKAQFAAELLAGEMPAAIDEVFRGAGGSLFPDRREQLTTGCSCPDSGDPCKHVAATYYVLGEAFDRDPFLLFELRGRNRDEVLAALREARRADGGNERAAIVAWETKTATEAATEAEADTAAKSASASGVDLSALSAGEYDRPREPLPSLHFSFDTPTAPGSLLRQLGSPPGWSESRSPAEELEPIIRKAAETARAVAFARTEKKRR